MRACTTGNGPTKSKRRSVSCREWSGRSCLGFNSKTPTRSQPDALTREKVSTSRHVCRAALACRYLLHPPPCPRIGWEVTPTSVSVVTPPSSLCSSHAYYAPPLRPYSGPWYAWGSRRRLGFMETRLHWPRVRLGVVDAERKGLRLCARARTCLRADWLILKCNVVIRHPYEGGEGVR